MFPGNFSRCTFSTDFRWVPYHVNIIRKVYFYVKIYIQGTWLEISFTHECCRLRLSLTVLGQSSMRTASISERNKVPSGFVSFFILKCHLKKNSTVENLFAITSSSIWKHGELYKSEIRLWIIQLSEIQTVLKLLCFNEEIEW